VATVGWLHEFVPTLPQQGREDLNGSRIMSLCSPRRRPSLPSSLPHQSRLQRADEAHNRGTSCSEPCLQRSAWPPSTLQTAPVTNEASSEAKNEATSATSSRSTSLPSSTCFIGKFLTASPVFQSPEDMLSKKAASMGPGMIQSALMLSLPYSRAVILVKCITPALAIPYAPRLFGRIAQPAYSS
jgi:hypothetical protein